MIEEAVSHTPLEAALAKEIERLEKEVKNLTNHFNRLGNQMDKVVKSTERPLLKRFGY